MRRERERDKRNLCPQKFQQKAITKLKKRKNSEDGITAEIPEALSEKQKGALAENLNERCKNRQFDEGLTKGAAVLLPQK